MTETISLVVLSAGLSTPSSTRMLADQLSRAATTALGGDSAHVRAKAMAGHRAHVGADVTGDAEASAPVRGEAGSDIEVEVEVTTVELREYAHDITDALLTRFPNERLSMVVEQVRAADAVIAVTPVFNVGPSGLFKTFFDAIDIEIWRSKPVLLGATAGTARHSLAIDYAIRPMFGYLKADVVPTVVFAASADFGADTEDQADEQPLSVRVRRAAAELATMVRAGLGETGQVSGTIPVDGGISKGAAGGDATGDSGDAARPALGPEFSDFVPMGTLLRRG